MIVAAFPILPRYAAWKRRVPLWVVIATESAVIGAIGVLSALAMFDVVSSRLLIVVPAAGLFLLTLIGRAIDVFGKRS